MYYVKHTTKEGNQFYAQYDTEATFLFSSTLRELPGASSVSQLAGSPVCGGVIIKSKYPATVLPVLETESYSAHVGMKILAPALLQYIWQFVGVCDGVADQILYW